MFSRYVFKKNLEFYLRFFVILPYFVMSFCMEESEKVLLTSSWAIHIENSTNDIANEIATRHGFVNLGQVGSIPGHYHFVRKTSEGRRKRREIVRTKELLLTEDKVKWVEPQVLLERDKRSIVPEYVTVIHPTAYTVQDPLFKDQWYLNNLGQSNGPSGLDINVLPVWAKGLSGRGIVVAILDDGVDHTHPDLKANYDPKASYDFNDYDNDPMPRVSDPTNCHGTKCAGEVAAEANNGMCGVGVAFNCSIGGIRMLDGNTTDTIEGSALSYHNNYIDIYSCAWGPKDDGKRFGRPGTLASKALELGTKEGRNGLGSIFVWATGNGGLTDDDCNADGYTTSVYTVSIGAISDHGLSTYYTESCSSTLAVTYSGGSHREKVENKIVTTTLNHKCTEEFKGTSSAAPLAAGMIALALEANPKLTWRDVQHLIVETSIMTSPLDEGWKRNGVGKWFNQKFGFGRMDAAALVEKAATWDTVAEQRTCWSDRMDGPWDIPDSGTLMVASNATACTGTLSEIKSLEHVQVVISLKHRRRGHLSIELISPSGTRTQLLKTRRNDKSTKGLKDWEFMSVHFWGEDPKGLWTLAITDNSNNNREHHREKSKYGDLEDATELLHDEMDAQDKEKGVDTEHEVIVDDQIFQSAEEFENRVFKNDSFKKKGRKVAKLARPHPEKKPLADASVSTSGDGELDAGEISVAPLAHAKKAARRPSSNQILRPSEPQLRHHHPHQKANPNLQSYRSNSMANVLDGPKNPFSLWYPQGAMTQLPQFAPFGDVSQGGFPARVANLENAYSRLPSFPDSPTFAPLASMTSASGKANITNAASSDSSSAAKLPPDLAAVAGVNGSQNNSLEKVLRTVLTELFVNLRAQENNASSSKYTSLEQRLRGLEKMVSRNHKIETVSAVLLKALKKGAPLEKVTKVLSVLEKHRNATIRKGGNFSKNTEVVTDVLKVMKDILSSNKVDKHLSSYKERISKLLEGSSNSTRQLTEKLFRDMEPSAGREKSGIVISDALNLISAIFGNVTDDKLALRKVLEIPKDASIVLKGPKGNIVVPFSSVQDLLASNEILGKVVTTTTASKEIHHENGNVEAMKIEHINIDANNNRAVSHERGFTGANETVFENAVLPPGRAGVKLKEYTSKEDSSPDARPTGSQSGIKDLNASLDERHDYLSKEGSPRYLDSSNRHRPSEEHSSVDRFVLGSDANGNDITIQILKGGEIVGEKTLGEKQSRPRGNEFQGKAHLSSVGDADYIMDASRETDTEFPVAKMAKDLDELRKSEMAAEDQRDNVKAGKAAADSSSDQEDGFQVEVLMDPALKARPTSFTMDDMGEFAHDRQDSRALDVTKFGSDQVEKPDTLLTSSVALADSASSGHGLKDVFEVYNARGQKIKRLLGPMGQIGKDADRGKRVHGVLGGEDRQSDEKGDSRKPITFTFDIGNKKAAVTKVDPVEKGSLKKHAVKKHKSLRHSPVHDEVQSSDLEFDENGNLMDADDVIPFLQLGDPSQMSGDPGRDEENAFPIYAGPPVESYDALDAIAAADASFVENSPSSPESRRATNFKRSRLAVRETDQPFENPNGIWPAESVIAVNVAPKKDQSIHGDNSFANADSNILKTRRRRSVDSRRNVTYGDGELRRQKRSLVSDEEQDDLRSPAAYKNPAAYENPAAYGSPAAYENPAAYGSPAAYENPAAYESDQEVLSEYGQSSPFAEKRSAIRDQLPIQAKRQSKLRRHRKRTHRHRHPRKHSKAGTKRERIEARLAANKIVGSIASSVKVAAGTRQNIPDTRRSAVRRALALENKLKEKLLSMRQESSSVLDIMKRVHHDIASGNSDDLRDLEVELARLEEATKSTPSHSVVESKTDNRAIVKPFASRRRVGGDDEDSTVAAQRIDVTNETDEPEGHAQLMGLKEQMGPSAREWERSSEPKQSPDEYYKYGVSASGELEEWTILFYGTSS